MKKSLFLTSAIMTAVLAVGLSTSTYAWYSTTVGKAATSTTTINAAANNVDAEYKVAAPVLAKISQAGAGTAVAAAATWTNAGAQTGTEITTEITDENLLGAAYGHATNEGAEAAAHWYTAVLFGGEETLDSTSKGILALRFTYTIPGVKKGSIIKSQYKVVSSFSVTATIGGAAVAVPFTCAYTTDAAEGVSKALTGVEAYAANATAVQKNYAINEAEEGAAASTADQVKYLIVYIDGTKIGKESTLVDIDQAALTINFNLSVEAGQAA